MSKALSLLLVNQDITLVASSYFIKSVSMQSAQYGTTETYTSEELQYREFAKLNSPRVTDCKD